MRKPGTSFGAVLPANMVHHRSDDDRRGPVLVQDHMQPVIQVVLLVTYLLGLQKGSTEHQAYGCYY